LGRGQKSKSREKGQGGKKGLIRGRSDKEKGGVLTEGKVTKKREKKGHGKNEDYYQKFFENKNGEGGWGEGRDRLGEKELQGGPDSRIKIKKI